MEQFLVNHALQNVWCNPWQDKQIFFAARRITPLNGALNRFQLMNRQIDLPNKGKRYHVFSIGQLNPSLIGFQSNQPSWVTEYWRNVADSIEENQIMISVYTKDGNCIPRFQTYFMFTNERDLIFVVEDNPNIKMDFNNDQIYFRVYSNAYFETQGVDNIVNFMRCEGQVVNNVNDILNYQSKITTLRQKDGYLMCFVNGFIIDDISPLTVQIGDLMEYVYDSSVKRIVTFTASDLNTFNSTLDGVSKFLLHYVGTGDNTIDYEDDIDIYILAPQAFNRYKGYYYHHNTIESIRMVTHRDYSIVVDYFKFIANQLAADISSTPLDIMTFKIQLIVRRSGTNHSLIHDNSRIFELYKMTDDKIVQAMVGLNSTLPIWRAENLENNSYTALMRSPHRSDVTLDMVQDAYGYNSISKIVADTPQKTTLISGRQTANLPEALIGDCTVYEYDVNGLLLGWHYYTGDITYQAVDINTCLIESLAGKGTNQPDSIFGQDNIPLPTYDDYRVYACFLVNGEPNNDWRDITGTSAYNVVNNTLIWTGEQIQQFLMIRKDNTFLAYDFEQTCVNGNLFFTLTELEDRGLGDGVQTYSLPVPMGDIDIFVNNNGTIEKLDYTIIGNTVYVVNKKYLVQPGETSAQKIHVRASGFCDSKLNWQTPDDYGFIKYGYLSNNNSFDIRDDKVLRITVDGKTMDRSDLKFSEDNTAVYVADPTNGLPYQIKDIVVPLKQLVDDNTYTLRDKSLAIDKAISDYMTIKDPETDRGSLTIIQDKYPVVSTFVSRILQAITDNEVTQQQIEAATSDNSILALCQPFEYTLQYDPVNEELNYDYNYVRVEPHHNNTVISLQLYQYKFLTKVASLYCRGVVELSPFFTITT